MKQDLLATPSVCRTALGWLWLGALALLAGACGSDDATQLGVTTLDAQATGSLALGLSSTSGADEFRFVGSIGVLNAAGEPVAVVDAAEDSPATQTVSLAPGQYGVSVADGYFCTYSGSTPGFSGCSFVGANPNPFEILSGEPTGVALEVSLHFEQGQDVTALLRAGAAAFSLIPSVEVAVRCGEGPGCEAGQICASLDASGPECHTPCVSSAECGEAAECIAVFMAEPSAGSASPRGVCERATGG